MALVSERSAECRDKLKKICFTYIRTVPSPMTGALMSHPCSSRISKMGRGFTCAAANGTVRSIAAPLFRRNSTIRTLFSKLQRTSLGSDILGCEVQYRSVWRRLRGLRIDMLVQIADATLWSRGQCWVEDTSGLEGALLREALLVVLTFRLPLVTVPMLTSSHKDEGKQLLCYRCSHYSTVLANRTRPQ